MEDEANARLNLLRTEGRSAGHDEGVTTRSEEEEEDLDLARLQRGISYFRHNFFSMFVAMLTGLLTLMYVETIAAVLEATKRSGSAPLSFSRYLSTLNHTLAWYKGAADLAKSTARVRVLHRQAARVMSFSQYEMVVTQWAFVGPALLWPDQLGIARASRGQEEGLVYVMFRVGQQLGIQDRHNLCSGSVAEVRARARAVLRRELQPVFLSAAAPAACTSLATHLLAGVNILNPFINPDSFRSWAALTVHERGSWAEQLQQLEQLDRFSAAMLRLQLAVLQLFHAPVLGPALRLAANTLMRLNLYLASDWRDWILAQQEAGQQRSGGVAGVAGAVQAVLIIPIMVTISGLALLKSCLWKHRSELLAGTVCAFLLVITLV